MSDLVINTSNKTLVDNNAVPWGKEFFPQGTGNDELDYLLASAGYSYDSKQDIFYSILDPWQRDVGYCRLYDEAAAPLSMIMDCEPIYFEYRDEKWLIQFWKGQYGMVTGGEIGVYSGGVDFNILGFWQDTFYNCAGNDDLLQMSYTLKKDGKILFTRDAKHWWLTGFMLGEFSEPSQLTMDLEITLKDQVMLDAFVGGLMDAGYSENEFTVIDNTVSLTFNTPHTKQPLSRTVLTDWVIQRKNQLLCNKYNEITEAFDTFQDKVNAIEEQAPYLYHNIIRIGKEKSSFDRYEAIIIASIIIGLFVSYRLVSRNNP